MFTANPPLMRLNKVNFLIWSTPGPASVRKKPFSLSLIAKPETRQVFLKIRAGSHNPRRNKSLFEIYSFLTWTPEGSPHHPLMAGYRMIFWVTSRRRPSRRPSRRRPSPMLDGPATSERHSRNRNSRRDDSKAGSRSHPSRLHPSPMDAPNHRHPS